MLSGENILTQEQLEEIQTRCESHLGERFGVYASTIGRALKKLGVGLRSRWQT
jgi:hypothetical protein